MKKFVLMIMAILGVEALAAQPGGFGGGMPMGGGFSIGSILGGTTFDIQESIKKTTDSLTLELNLDKKQSKKMKKALEYDYNSNIMSTVTSLISQVTGRELDAETQAQIDKEKQKREERYAKFLNPEQFEKWKENERIAQEKAVDQARELMEMFRNGEFGGFGGGGFPGGGMPPMGGGPR